MKCWFVRSTSCAITSVTATSAVWRGKCPSIWLLMTTETDRTVRISAGCRGTTWSRWGRFLDKDGRLACASTQTHFCHDCLLRCHLNLNRFRGAVITLMTSPSDWQARRGPLVVETLLTVGKTAASKVTCKAHLTRSSQETASPQVTLAV